MATRDRHTVIVEFEVLCIATFGTACPKADKQWQVGRYHCSEVLQEAVLFVCCAGDCLCLP